MNRRFQILWLLTTLIVIGCTRNIEKKESHKPKLQEIIKSKTNENFSKIILLDRFDNKLIKDTATKKTEAQFSPVYIGEKKTNISLTYKTEKIGNRVSVWDKYKRPESESIVITIDTSQTIGSPMGVWEYYKKPEF